MEDITRRVTSNNDTCPSIDLYTLLTALPPRHPFEHLVPHPTLETYRSTGDVSRNVLRLRGRRRGGRRPMVRLGRHDSLCGTEIYPSEKT